MAGADATGAPFDEHSWGQAHPTDGGDGPGSGGVESRSGPSAAAVRTAVRVLSDASEDQVMDVLKDVRLKARAKLAALFAQSVAEGHFALDY